MNPCRGQVEEVWAEFPFSVKASTIASGMKAEKINFERPTEKR